MKASFAQKARTIQARRLAPVAMVAVAALAGCSTPSGGMAFSVNGQSVSNSTVEKAATDCATAAKVTRDDTRQQVANMLLEGLVAQQVAQKNGITITDAQIKAAASNAQVTPLLDGAGCQTAVESYLRLQVLEGSVSAQKIISDAAGLHVVVNPKYGPYQPSQISLPGGSGSLSNDGTGPITISQK